jgi:hypothetical protein
MISASGSSMVGKALSGTGSEGRPGAGAIKLTAVLWMATAAAGWAATGATAESYSVAAGQDFPRRVYWGDTHVHSNLSLDANMSGNVSLSPASAYRFARGEKVLGSSGMPVKLRRPLDFLVVSDHAEYIGVMDGLRREDAQLLEHETARRWGSALAAGDRSPMAEFAASLSAGQSVLEHPAFDRTVWERTLALADSHNEPGIFTALIGYEWTSMPGGRNLHRVVLFGDDGTQVQSLLPFSAFDSDDPEDLWAHLARYEQETGGRAMAIPHNANLSGGTMFPDREANGAPMSQDYAQRRARWEPLVEVTQVKGDGEAHPFLSPDDEFADYETWDRSDVSLVNAHQDSWYPHEYARAALKLGLDLEARTGVNPYRFGMIGSTDSHTGLSTAEEDNFWGKFSGAEPSSERWERPMVAADLPFMTYEWQMAASGYAAVWARENTRAGIFEALTRREVYATTGPRMTVRLFGGWRFDAADAHAPDLPAVGYAGGVPMGGVLSPRPDDADAPVFLVSALKDPDGANLDRIQIVKGWRLLDGSLMEQVHDVVGSDGRVPDADGRLAPVGSTVDVQNASYSNSIGAAELVTWWRDLDFDPALQAFYYVRVLEIPTPRWTTYDAKFFGLKLPDQVPRVTRYRAYTSPIWYSPPLSRSGAGRSHPDR